jgi:hypothetical protein
VSSVLKTYWYHRLFVKRIDTCSYLCISTCAENDVGLTPGLLLSVVFSFAGVGIQKI